MSVIPYIFFCDEGTNIKSVNEVESTLVQNIEEIRNQLLRELQSDSEFIQPNFNLESEH